jgi:hypothetical protein
MNGSRQHAPRSADLKLHLAAVGLGDNTGARVNTHIVMHESNAHEQMPTLGLCSCSSCCAEAPAPIPEGVYSLPLSALDLSIRLRLVFQRAGISTVGQLLEMELEAFEHLKLGERSIQEVVQRVQALGVLGPLQDHALEPSYAASSMMPADPGPHSDSPGPVFAR